jgi:transmembrane sensor
MEWMPDHQPPQELPTPGYAGMEIAALRRYIAGACSPEERRRVNRWASESPERQRYLKALSALYHRADAESARSAAEAWSRVQARMAPPAATDSSVGAAPWVAPWEEPAERIRLAQRRRARVLGGAFGALRTERRGSWPLLALAAAIVLAAAGLNTVFVTAIARRHATVPHAPVMREIVTATGQRAEVRLDDGTRVTLGVASHLRLPGDFGAHSREVYLDGTAYFDVVHDSVHPFVVRTANAVARDVGTRFVVNAYPEAHATRVVVRDGAVSLGAGSRTRASRVAQVLLTGGHLGQLRAGDSVVTTRRVDPALYTAWMRGDLVFQDTPLSEAIAELRRWYDVDVRLGDASLGDVPISASFAAESFHEALAVVTTVLPLRAVRRGNVVTLYRRRS